MNQPAHPTVVSRPSSRRPRQLTRALSWLLLKLRVTLQVWMLLALLVNLAHSQDAHAADAANRQQAIEIALQQNGGGKVLGVKSVKNNNGRTVFAVKVLNNGRVRVFRIKKAK